MAGIENLKVAVLASVNFAEAIDKKMDDGKITLLEALSAGVGSFGDIVKVIKSGKAIAEEFKDLDSDERTELSEYVAEELDLSNDKVEAIVEKSVSFLLSIDEMIELIKDKSDEPSESEEE